MAAPTGEEFQAGGETYVIRPKLTTRNTINALKRLYKRRRREEIMEAIRDFEENAKSLPPDMVADMREELAKQYAFPYAPKDVDALGELETVDGIATCLVSCCDNINSFNQACDVIEKFSEENGHAFDLAQLIAKASGMDEVKNSVLRAAKSAEDTAEMTEEMMSQ